MSLKSSMRDEARRVFLNLSDFAEEILIDGHPMTALCEWLIEPQGQALYGAPGNRGIQHFEAEIMLDVESIQVPEPGQQLRVNNRVWTVHSVEIHAGLLSLRLYRNI